MIIREVGRQVPKCICVSGIDGSGKSTVCKYIAAVLESAGYDVDVQWRRFNHLFSKPLLFVCRIVGLTRYQHVNGIRVGYHDFYKSKVVSWLFIWLQFVDALIVRIIFIQSSLSKKGRVLVLDRYVPDILVDLMVDTRINGLMDGRLAKLFMRLIPAEAQILVISRERVGLLEARPENVVDESFEARFGFYETLAKSLSVDTLNNDGSLEELLVTVERKIGVRREN